MFLRHSTCVSSITGTEWNAYTSSRRASFIIILNAVLDSNSKHFKITWVTNSSEQLTLLNKKKERKSPLIIVYIVQNRSWVSTAICRFHTGNKVFNVCIVFWMWLDVKAERMRGEMKANVQQHKDTQHFTFRLCNSIPLPLTLSQQQHTGT